MERFYRANLINGITGYKPANLIGTMNPNAVPNLAIFSSVVHLGSDPALIGFIHRPLTALSHTYKNIIRTGKYTINHVHSQMIDAAHLTSAKFNEDESEFDMCGLTPEWKEGIEVPFVKESHIKMSLTLVDEKYIKHNDTRLMIGEIQHIIIDEQLIAEDGNVLLQAADSVALSGLGHYFKTSLVSSLPYVHKDAIGKS